MTEQTADDASSVTYISGGVNLTGDQVTIGGDVVGRDKIVQNIQHIYERALTAAEQAAKARSIEAQYLAEGVSAFAQRLQARVKPTAGAGASPGVALAGASPYRGLLSFGLGDAEVFFGRERAIQELLQHLGSGSLTVLHAESGAGKTSLLQAGLAPRLIGGGHLPVYLRPYDKAPAEVLKRAFVSDLTLTPALKSAPLADFLRQVAGVLGPDTTMYVLLDQFEEFFTHVDEPARANFVGELADCLDDVSLNVRWVLSLRSESFGRLASFRPRIRSPFDNDYQLNRLTRDEAALAAVGPLRRHAISFEDGLLDQILGELGATEIAPPQLQLVCTALFAALPPGEKRFTLALYQREGRAPGILRDHLQRVLSRDLQQEQRAAAQRLLESLITSEQQRVIRTHQALVAELTLRGVTPHTLDVILNQLIDSRLIKAEETDEGVAYELAHDYLLDEIKLDPKIKARKAAQELLEQELRAFRRYGALLSADRLSIIESFRSDLPITAEADHLLERSREAIRRERRRRRQMRWLLGVTAAILAGIVLIAGPGQWIYHELLKAEAQRLSPLIPLAGGMMIAGANAPGREPEELALQEVEIGAFSIERTEVTNRQYRLCWQAGGCQREPSNRRYFDDPRFDDYPVVAVAANQAAEYCRWLGRRLPDELEWERAARGLNGLPWQWRDGSSDPPSASTANVPSSSQTPTDILPVGSFPDGATPEGALDLVGNVWEWTSTALSCDEARSCARSAWNGTDLVPLAVRGGAWNFQIERITQVLPGMADASDIEVMVGFRCAHGR